MNIVPSSQAVRLFLNWLWGTSLEKIPKRQPDLGGCRLPPVSPLSGEQARGGASVLHLCPARAMHLALQTLADPVAGDVRGTELFQQGQMVLPALCRALASARAAPRVGEVC